MDARFGDWMVSGGGDSRSVASYVSTLGRIEAAYGDLDAAFIEDRFAVLLGDLSYTTADRRDAVPNPSRVPINGDLYNGLATLRSTLNKYRQFRDETDGTPLAETADDLNASTSDARTFTLERDMQDALRQSIEQLEPGLVVIDGGAEHVVASGRIDILAKDPSDVPVVIELKAVRAGRDAVGQILAYMGDVAADSNTPTRGLLIAPEFDHKAVSAASVVPSLRLVTYTYNFAFAAVCAD